MKKIIFLIFIICCSTKNYSQLYITKTGFIGFYSSTSLEDIKAENNQVYAIVDAGKKNIAFSLLVKGFLFPRELMQQHFNENYMESDKFPKANFTGNFIGDVDAGKDGIYNVVVKGQLTLHNTTKPIEAPATIEIKKGKLLGNAQFKIKPEDYNINIPSVVRDKIAKEMTITIKIECTPK